jgi:hypothetical protein
VAASGAKRLFSSQSTHRVVDLMEAFFSEAFRLSRIDDRLRRRAEGASCVPGMAGVLGVQVPCAT